MSTSLLDTRCALGSSSRPYVGPGTCKTPFRRKSVYQRKPYIAVKPLLNRTLIEVSCRANAQEYTSSTIAAPSVASKAAHLVARILIAIPLGLALFGFAPRPAHAGSRSAPPPPAALIDHRTGLPRRWLYSSGDWNQNHLRTIHTYYANPIQSISEERHLDQRHIGSNSQLASVPASTSTAAQNNIVLQSVDSLRTAVGEALLSHVAYWKRAVTTTAEKPATTATISQRQLHTVTSNNAKRSNSKAVPVVTEASPPPKGSLDLALSAARSLLSTFSWNPQNLAGIATPSSNGPRIAPSGASFALPQAPAIVAGIILAFYILDVLRRRSLVLGPEAVESIDTQLINVPSLQVPGSEDEHAEDLWPEAAAGTRGAALASATAAIVGSGRVWNTAPMPRVRSRDELQVEANRRIVALKEMELAAAQKGGVEVEVLASLPDASQQTAESLGKMEIEVGQTKVEVGKMEMEMPSNGTGDLTFDDGTVTNDKDSTKQEDQTRMFWWQGREEHSSSSIVDLKAEAAVDPPSSVPANSVNTAEAGSVFDGRSHATPFVVLLGLAAAFVSQLQPLIHPLSPVELRSRRPLSVASVKGAGKQLVVSSTRPRQGRRNSSNHDNQSGDEHSHWGSLALDVLLAPAAPLLAVPNSSTTVPRVTQRGPSVNKYDALYHLLKSALDSESRGAGEKSASPAAYDPVRQLLDTVPPRPGAARHDFIGQLMLGLAEAQDRPAAPAPYDAVGDMLTRAIHTPTQSIDAGGSKYCPVNDLLHASRLIEDWGPVHSKYDPFQGAIGRNLDDWSGWGGPVLYCPITALLSMEAPEPGASKYDPMMALTRVQAPCMDDGGAAWDPVRWMLRGWSGPWAQGVAKETSGYDPLAAMIAEVQPPSSRSKYDVLQALFASSAPMPETEVGLVRVDEDRVHNGGRQENATKTENGYEEDLTLQPQAGLYSYG